MHFPGTIRSVHVIAANPWKFSPAAEIKTAVAGRLLFFPSLCYAVRAQVSSFTSRLRPWPSDSILPKTHVFSSETFVAETFTRQLIAGLFFVPPPPRLGNYVKVIINAGAWCQGAHPCGPWSDYISLKSVFSSWVDFSKARHRLRCCLMIRRRLGDKKSRQQKVPRNFFSSGRPSVPLRKVVAIKCPATSSRGASGPSQQFISPQITDLSNILELEKTYFAGPGFSEYWKCQCEVMAN